MKKDYLSFKSKKGNSAFKTNSKLSFNKTKKILLKKINYNSGLEKVLKQVCKYSTECMNIGPYSEYVKRYFNNFTDTKYIDKKNIKMIAKGSNGKVSIVPFIKNDFVSYTVVKFPIYKIVLMTMLNTNDNLYYEYYVGKYFINKYINKFPTFIETYHLVDSKFEPIKYSKKNFWSESCLKYKTPNGILIQHYDPNNFFTYNELLYMDENYETFLDIPFMCYQIYFTLSILCDIFTHNDLHYDNVAVYKPFNENECIQFIYHSKGKIYKFKSEYIVKIIDYGRCYFNNGIVTSSEICKNILCDVCEDCGSYAGYNDICNYAYEKNISQDLRFLNYITKNHEYDLHFEIKYDNKYKTEEVLQFEDPKLNKNVTNVLEAIAHLEYHFDSYSQKHYDNHKVVAELEVYDDGSDYRIRML